MSRILLIPDISVQDHIRLSESFTDFVRNEVDFSIANLEGYISEDSNKNEVSSKKAEFFDLANGIKLKYVSVANNHFLDGGHNNSSTTIRYLCEHNIILFGTDKKPYVCIVAKEKRICVLGSVWALTGRKQAGLNKFLLNIGEQQRIVRSLVDTNMKIIWFPHWGTDMEILPSPWQVGIAEKMILAGADIIYGHHAHLIQPAASNGEETVVFCGGNFVMSFNETTYCYSKDAFKTMVALYGTESEELEFFFTKYEPGKGKLCLETSNRETTLTVKHLEYLRTQTYEEDFGKYRTKKSAPILGNNILTNIPKVVYTKLLVSAFSMGIIRKTWRLLKGVFNR